MPRRLSRTSRWFAASAFVAQAAAFIGYYAPKVSAAMAEASRVREAWYEIRDGRLALATVQPSLSTPCAAPLAAKD